MVTFGEASPRTPPDPDRWWLDDERMLRPLFVAGDEVPPSVLAIVERQARERGTTVVLPGQPGHHQATQRMIDTTDGFVVWFDRQLGIVDVAGARGVFVHQYAPWTFKPWRAVDPAAG